MSKQIISSGTVANDKTGDNLRNSAGKINANFNELYSALGNGTQLSVAQVAKTGNYNDLANKPSIPTDISQLADSNGLLNEFANLDSLPAGTNIGRTFQLGNAAQHTNLYFGNGELGLSAILDTGFGPNEYSRGTVRVIPALVELISSDDDEPGVQYNAKVEVSYSSGVTISKSTPYNTDSWVFNNTQLTTPGPINLKNNLKIEALDVAGLYEIYQESLAVLNDYFTVVSYTGLGYPASKNSFEQLSRAKATNPLIQDAWITAAKTLEDNYYAWAAATTTLTPSSSGFTINNGDNVGWKFEELTGLQFPDGTKQTTAYTGASPQVINVVDDEDFNINVSALGMTSPPGQVASQFTFKSNGDLQLPGNLVIPQDEDFSITTSAYSMGSPPGVFSNNFTFKGNGEFVVPWVIKSQYNYFSIESPDTLRLDAPGTIQLGIMGTEHVNIGSATGPTGSNRVSIQSDNVQILSNPPTSSQGKNGDYQGMIAFDNDYMYYCTAPYNYGTDIWKRVALTGGMW